jgi:16S rRNA (guanine1516-N2)-methyltransferase
VTTPLRLVVTTSRKPSSTQRERARELASRFGAALCPRDAPIETLVEAAGADGAYVVGRGQETVRLGTENLHIHPGMLYLKQKDGMGHPLMRAVAPEDGAPVRRIIDCTLGAASDALHIARMLPDVQIVGAEVSVVLHALLEEGLPRLASDTARPWGSAARIEAHCVDARTMLEGMEDDSADVVFLDPMFRRPRGGSGGFGVLRKLAVEDVPDDALLAQAHRVARRRVVAKISGALPVPFWAPPSPGWNRRVRGGAVDYLVCERELAEPEWDLPDL